MAFEVAPSKNSLKRRTLPSRGLETRLRAGLEGFDAPAQGRRRRDAQNVIHPVGPTPVEDLGAAIVAVGAQQDFGARPVGADGAQQPKPNDVGQAAGDLVRHPRIDHAGGEPIGDAKAPLDLAHRQNPGVRRQQAAIELDHVWLAARR